MKDKKVVFMGTPEFSVPVLEMLIKNTSVVLVVTQPDKCVGRKMEQKFSPVKDVAIKNDIPVFQPTKIREDYEKVLEANPDIIITCAYGQIIPNVLLYTPKYKAINVHASLLPKLRGGAPIHRAIINDYSTTGVTIMYMAENMDDGDIISQEEVDIDNNENVGTLHDKLSNVGASLLEKVLPTIFDGSCSRIKQDESEVTFGYNIKREEELIDFSKTAREVYNQIRGLYPFPCAYTIINGEEVKILESKILDNSVGDFGEITNVLKEGIVIKCKDKSIFVTRLKPNGKKAMSGKDYVNGIKKDEYIGVRL